MSKKKNTIFTKKNIIIAVAVIVGLILLISIIPRFKDTGSGLLETTNDSYIYNEDNLLVDKEEYDNTNNTSFVLSTDTLVSKKQVDDAFNSNKNFLAFTYGYNDSNDNINVYTVYSSFQNSNTTTLYMFDVFEIEDQKLPLKAALAKESTGGSGNVAYVGAEDVVNTYNNLIIYQNNYRITINNIHVKFKTLMEKFINDYSNKDGNDKVFHITLPATVEQATTNDSYTTTNYTTVIIPTSFINDSDFSYNSLYKSYSGYSCDIYL